jgi:hypothetical protein
MSEYVFHFLGYRPRVDGFGNLKATFYGFNKVRSSPMKDLDMSSLAQNEPMKLGNFIAQRALLRLEVTEIGEYFDLNRIEIFTKPIGTGYKS